MTTVNKITVNKITLNTSSADWKFIRGQLPEEVKARLDAKRYARKAKTIVDDQTQKE